MGNKVFSFITASLFLMAACNPEVTPTPEPEPKPEPQEPASVSLSNITSSTDAVRYDSTNDKLTINFTEAEGSVSFKLKASEAWGIKASNSHADSWLTISPASGNKGETTVKVSSKANDTYDERSADYDIICGSVKKSIRVVQKQKNAVLISEKKAEITEKGGELKIELQHNVDFEVKISEGCDWIQQVQTKGLQKKTLVFQVQENEGTKAREASITISSSLGSESVSVYQKGVAPMLVLGQSEYTVDSDAHNIEVLVTSNTPVTFEIIQGADWISDVSTKSTSTDKYMFSIAKNGSYDLREGVIVFRSTEYGLSEKVRITQMQKDAIVIAKSSYQIGNEGGDVVVELGHNVDFDISIDSNWIHQVQTKAFQTQKLTFAVESNPDFEERTATITFTSSDGKISQTISVYQEGVVPMLVLGQSEYTVDSDAHNIEVLVTSNTPVTFEIVKGAEWISDASTKSTSTDKYKFSIAKNGSYDLREGEIVFRSTELGLSEKVRITQMQKDAIVIAKSSYQIGNEGGDVVVELGHNVDFGISIDCNWVHQVQTKALQTRNLIFSVDSNPGYEERKATVTFTSSDGKISQAVEIKQSKNVELLVSQNEFLLGYQSRTFNLEVYSNEEYSIVMPDVDWLHKVETKALDWKSNTFMVDANDAPEVRTAQIVVLNEETGKSLTVQIIQYPVPQIILSTNFVEMDAEGGEFYVDVKSNVPFVVMYSQYYNIVTTDTPETFGTPVETTLHFMVSKNTEPFVQFATILFFDISGTLAATVEVKLAPNNSLETLPPIEEFTDLGRESITQINFYAGSDVTTDRYTNNGQLVYAKTVGTTLNLYTPSGKFKILDGREYFLNCSSLKSVDLTSWDTSECKYLSRLFYGCRSLEEVNLEGLDTHLAEDFTYMFSDCHKLKTVDLSFLKGAKCGTLEKMFAGIRDFMTLETVDLSGLDLSVLRSAHCMFQLCVYLKSVKLGDWNVPSTADLSGMFGYVAELSICDVYCSRTTAERLLGSDANCGINLRWHLDNGESFYRSSDYSKDGQVTLLQQATRGKGINIVLFGDGYSDRMISNGIYRSDMTRAMEHLFSQEPLRSYRDCFNVYEVTAVSESEYYYYGGSTAFSAVPITPVEWDEDKCMGNVKGIVGEDGLDAAVGIILMNTPSSVTGTAVMKKPSRYDPSVDYASGFGMLAASRGASDDDGAILLHEFGHAFAKLDEEYVLYTDSCSEGYIEFLTADMWMGWWSNVDFTSDLSKIKWSSYVHDDRYSSQHIGAYEGASHYAYGVWKPTEESIMNSYHPDFNAPSRETFYRRINKLAFGAEWEFDLEEFKVWDTSRPKTVRARRRTTSDPLQESPYLKSLQKQVKDYRVLNR